MSGAYSRIYHRIQDEFPDVFDDATALGTWTQLLVVAEAVHPNAAHLPRKVRKQPLKKLVDAGLVLLVPGDRYRIRGLDAERERRSEQGRKGGLASGERRTNVQRTLSERTANGEPRRDEQETSKDETRIETRASGPLSVTLDVIAENIADSDPIPVDVRRLQKLADDITGRPYSMVGGLSEKVVREQLPHGYDRVEAAWRQYANSHKAKSPVPPTFRQLVLGADEILNPITRLDATEVREGEARAAYDRRVAKTRELIRDYKH